MILEECILHLSLRKHEVNYLNVQIRDLALAICCWEDSWKSEEKNCHSGSGCPATNGNTFFRSKKNVKKTNKKITPCYITYYQLKPCIRYTWFWILLKSNPISLPLEGRCKRWTIILEGLLRRKRERIPDKGSVRTPVLGKEGNKCHPNFCIKFLVISRKSCTSYSTTSSWH